MVSPSKSQVNKAGKVLRRWARGELVGHEHDAALSVLLEHRAAFQSPLTKAAMALRSMVQTEGCRVEVSQRLKRIPTIVDKLRREPTMQLANMQDIGGCRAVLDSVDELRRVQARRSRNRPPLRVSDYIAAPRSSGYRAGHVVVSYDDRPIEVQLRTRVMHEWAIAVERTSGRMGKDLKAGLGPEVVLAFFRVVSEAMATEERGEIVDPSTVERVNAMREAALRYLGGGERPPTGFSTSFSCSITALGTWSTRWSSAATPTRR